MVIQILLFIYADNKDTKSIIRRANINLQSASFQKHRIHFEDSSDQKQNKSRVLLFYRKVCHKHTCYAQFIGCLRLEKSIIN
jgi:hypothetical protein